MTVLAEILSNTFMVGAGWFLLHAVWQGALIALALAAVLALVHERSSTLRYGLSTIALVLMLALPLLTAFGPLRADAPDALAISAPITSLALPALTDIGEAVSAEAVESRATSFAAPALLMLSAAAPWLVPFWLAGVCVLTIRTAGGWWAARRLTRVGVVNVPAPVARSFVELKRRFGVTAEVIIRQSTRLEVPAVIGYFRPVLLLPLSTLSGLSPAQLDAVIAHELAHIRRHDYLVHVFQQFVETLLFFHPAMWWVSGQVRREREHCCDDLAVEMCGDALSYATALLALEEQRGAPAPRLMMAATAGNLLIRVRRLLGRPVPRRATQTAFAPIVLLFACLSLVALTAQQSPSSTPSAPSPSSASSTPSASSDEAARQRTEWLTRFDQTTDRAARAEMISSLSGSTAPEDWNALLDIAQSDRDIAIRKTAISYIAGRPDVDTLSRLYDNATRRDLKLYLVSYIHGIYTEASRARLQAIAASERDRIVRAKVLDYLSGR